MATENITERLKVLMRSISETRNFLRQYLQAKIRESEIDVTFELIEILSYLYRKDGVNQQEIADTLVKDKSSMTYLIDGLVKRELAKRVDDEIDRRNKRIFLTDKGKELQTVVNEWVTDIYGKAAGGIKLSEIETAISLVQEMNTNLKEI